MRVVLEDAPVHKRAGVAFVGVTDHEFLFGRLARGEFPFLGGGESRAAPAAQSGFQHLVDDLARRHFQQRLGEGAVAVAPDIIVDVFGIDDAAARQDDAVLLGGGRPQLGILGIDGRRIGETHRPLGERFRLDLGQVSDCRNRHDISLWLATRL